MNQVLARWNRLSAEEAAREIVACCGSEAWAQKVAMRRPLENSASLMVASDEVWLGLNIPDWMEAFSKHPRIGERTPPGATSPQSAVWSAEEQSKVAAAGDSIQLALAEGNREYEQRFRRVFIVCATGKSASEILGILNRRLQNDEAAELQEVVEEQRKITNLRLKKWMCEMKRISTHILDLMHGRPAGDVPVRLERQESSGNWRIVGSAPTDVDGRCVLLECELTAGWYRLVFDTGSYFRALNIEALYPVVEVTFQVRDGESLFHIPLLLSANGYTTYRGN